jgi:hypothetical protein
VSDPAAAAVDSPLAAPGTSPAEARGIDARGRAGDDVKARPLERLELYAEERPPWIRLLVKGGDHHVVTWVNVGDAAALPGGSYVCRIAPREWTLTWNGPSRPQPVAPYLITEFRNVEPPLQRSIEATAGSIPAQVVRQQPDQPAPSPDAPGRGVPAPTLAFPLKPDPAALARSQELRDFAWQLLEHFFGAPPIRGRTVTMADIDALAAPRPAVSAALGRLTQAWTEMQRTKDPTLPRFRPLGELIVEQYTFGNETIVLNMLMIRDAPRGLGLYHRANDLKYYDEHGLPALDVMEANRRDVYYASRPRTTFRYAPPKADWATMKLLQVMGADPEIVALVEGLWANIDLYIEYRLGIDTDKVLRSMRQQAIMILLFLAAEGVLVLLERLGTAREKIAARILHVGLVATGRFLQIRFVADLKETLFLFGHHLYRVRRRPDGTLDDLSRDHFNQASDVIRPIVEEIVGMVLAGAALRVAAATAPLLDPPGGPTGMMFVPAPAGASGGRGSAGAPPAAGTGGAAPPPDFIVVMGTGSRPGSGEKPKAEEKKPKTPRELEEDVLGKNARPDTPFYFVRLNTTLRVALRELLAHLNNPKNQQYYKPNGQPPIAVNPEAVNMPTVRFLQQPQYRALLDRYWQLVTDAQNNLKRLRGKVDKATEKRLEDNYDAIQKFGSGNLGDKRPDGLEVFIDRRQFATTDASFEWWVEFHNFKHEVYVAAVNAATGLEGAGLEIETVPKSRLIEPQPEPEPAAPEPSEPGDD